MNYKYFQIVDIGGFDGEDGYTILNDKHGEQLHSENYSLAIKLRRDYIKENKLTPGQLKTIKIQKVEITEMKE